MEQPGMKFVAVRDIPVPGSAGAFAYRAGDLVHEAAVEGDDAWLTLGDDVRPREGASLSRPSRSASQAAWAAYAVSVGADSETAEGMSRKDLIAAYGEDSDQSGG